MESNFVNAAFSIESYKTLSHTLTRAVATEGPFLFVRLCINPQITGPHIREPGNNRITSGYNDCAKLVVEMTCAANCRDAISNTNVTARRLNLNQFVISSVHLVLLMEDVTAPPP